MYYQFHWRRRSIQFHYASSECQPIVCPKEGGAPGAGEGVYFDCDPECQEQKYYYYKKAESLINGRDFGEGYIWDTLYHPRVAPNKKPLFGDHIFFWPHIFDLKIYILILYLLVCLLSHSLSNLH